MSSLRILLVDDEPLARDRLRALLKGEADLAVIGECGNGPDAVEAIQREKPDVVFLDVQMPGCDGLQVVSRLPEKERPAIIFVTAHDKFAVGAFEVKAVDYVLKPFDRERLRVAVQRAREQVQARRGGALNQQLQQWLAQSSPPKGADRLAVKADGRLVLVKPDDIRWIEAADNYVILHLPEERLMLRETLSSLEERLGTTQFARINRSAIVHLDQIKELQPTFHGDYVVILRDGTKLPLSRSLRGQLGTLVRRDL